MNNVIEIMHKIHCGIDARLEGKSADVVLAEETKKIAIEFSKYIVNCKDLDGNIIGNNNHFIDNFGDLLFDKFIEEYYV